MKKQLFLVLMATILFVGCKKEPNESVPAPEQKVALNVSGGIQTRALNSTWEAGDAIGIYMLKVGGSEVVEQMSNRKYTTAAGDGKFTAATDQTIYFPLDGSNVDFIAYYPHTTTFNTDDALTLNVKNQNDLSAIDLLVAKLESTELKPLNSKNPTIAFNFTHRLTKLELTIVAGSGLTTADLTGLEVEITNQRINGSYDPLLEAFGVDSEPVEAISLNTKADGTSAQAILLPAEANSANPIIIDRVLRFTLASGEVFNWSIPNNKEFASGKKNMYEITINRSGIEVTSTITDWALGNGEGEKGNAE